MQKTMWYWIPVVLGLVLVSMQCPRKHHRLYLKKIAFDVEQTDERGLRHNSSYVDYEFCIPHHDSILAIVQQIEPDVRVMKGSRGRVGCTNSEWLCIVNTHDPEWKNKLFALASQPFITRIAEVFYE